MKFLIVKKRTQTLSNSKQGKNIKPVLGLLVYNYFKSINNLSESYACTCKPLSHWLVQLDSRLCLACTIWQLTFFAQLSIRNERLEICLYVNNNKHNKIPCQAYSIAAPEMCPWCHIIVNLLYEEEEFSLSSNSLPRNDKDFHLVRTIMQLSTYV